MYEFFKTIATMPITQIFVIAGIIFLLIAVIGDISGKISPGKTGRIASGTIGVILLGIGFGMYFQSQTKITDKPPPINIPGIKKVKDNNSGSTVIIEVPRSVLPKNPQPPPPKDLSTLFSSITTENTATKVEDEKWQWTIFIKGSDDAIKQVQCVEYTLHPTFQNPVQTVCQRGSADHAFPYTAIGWGTFTVKIRVIANNGYEKQLTHALKF